MSEQVERTYEYIEGTKERKEDSNVKVVQHQYTTGTSPMIMTSSTDAPLFTTATTGTFTTSGSTTAITTGTTFPLGSYYIRSRFNGFVLDAKNEGVKEGTEVILFPLKYSINQQFKFEENGIIRCLHNGYVLDYVHGMHGLLKGGFHWPSQVILTKYTGEASQHWDWWNGQIRNRLDGKVLDVKGESYKEGAACIVYDNHNAENQQWELIPLSSLSS